MKFIDIGPLVISPWVCSNHFINVDLITTICTARDDDTASYVFLAGELVDDAVKISMTPEEFIKVIEE